MKNRHILRMALCWLPIALLASCTTAQVGDSKFQSFGGNIASLAVTNDGVIATGVDATANIKELMSPVRWAIGAAAIGNIVNAYKAVDASRQGVETTRVMQDGTTTRFLAGEETKRLGMTLEAAAP